MSASSGNPMARVLQWTTPGGTPGSGPWLLGVFGIVLVLVLAVGVAYGPVFTPDGVRDQYLADALLAANFDVARYLGDVRPWMDRHGYTQSPLPYLLFHALLAGIRSTLEVHWHWGLIVCNAVAHVAALAMTVWVYLRARGSTAGAVVIFLAGAACWEFVQWVPQTQVDSTFVAAITAAFVLLARALPGRPGWLPAALAMLLVANLWKPTAVVAVAIAAVVLALSLAARHRDAASLSRLVRRVTLAGLALLALLLPVLVYPLYDPSVLPDGIVENSFRIYHRYAEDGHIVWSRPEYQLASMDGYLDYIVLVAARLVLFFGFTSEMFSSGHNLVNAVFFVPFYLLVAFGIWTVFVGRRLPHELQILGCFAVAWIALYDAFHAVTLLDFDWRYRTVTYPALLVLMACALDSIGAQVRERLAGASSLRT